MGSACFREWIDSDYFPWLFLSTGVCSRDEGSVVAVVVDDGGAGGGGVVVVLVGGSAGRPLVWSSPDLGALAAEADPKVGPMRGCAKMATTNEAACQVRPRGQDRGDSSAC